jgi:predicted DsbA family dithiol-disulfide isomerase
VKVEIFSDVACPFCFIGKRNFERALEAFPYADEVRTTWRSFQLDPTASTEPQGDTYTLLAAKYGVSVEEAKAMSGRVGAMAEAAGLNLDFEKVVHVSTFDAHRTAHLARSEGKEDRMIERLFVAYFMDGENIADRRVLARLAEESGIDPELTTSALDSDRFAEEVHAEINEARSLGLNGVPAFVIDRSLLVSGAQPPEVMLGALQQARGSDGPAQPSAGAASSEA